MLCINLPTPPSANSLYATNFKTKRRFKTKEYEAWIKLAESWLLSQKPHWRGREVMGRANIHIRVPEDTRGDTSNRTKAAEDMLVRAGITSDDRNNYKVTTERDPRITHCVVTIEAVA